MAAYPTLRQSSGSVKEISHGTQVDRMESGKPRLRTLYSQTWSSFKLVHECNTTEKDSILSHYAGDKLNSFSMTFQGDSTAYTVRYVNKPLARPITGNYEWLVEVMLVQV